MAIVNKPNTFSSNTTISSSEVNSNFDTLYNEFNGSISAANLADDAVTEAKVANDSIDTLNVKDGAITPPKWTNPYKFSVTGTSTSVSASAVIVKFSTEAYDSNSNYDPSTGLYTAAIAGFYEFTATIVVSTSNGGNNTGGFYVYKNGSNVRTLMSWAVGAISAATGGTANFTLLLAANDTVAIYANNSIATSYGQGAFEGRLLTIT